MKLYSDKLTDQDIRKAVPPRCGLETFQRRTGRVQLAERAWDVLLNSADSWRPFATGTRGGEGQGAASWDDYGAFLSALYEVDPAMKVRATADYQGRDHFHQQTHGAYRPADSGPQVCAPAVASWYVETVHDLPGGGDCGYSYEYYRGPRPTRAFARRYLVPAGKVLLECSVKRTPQAAASDR